MRRRAFLTLLLGGTVLGGCAAAAPAPEPLVLGPFVGTLVCADCPGIETELTLIRKAAGWAEGTYRLQRTYIDRGPPVTTTGDWTTLRGDAGDEDAVVYQLDPDHPETVQNFKKIDEKTVRMLDGEMREIPGGVLTGLHQAH